MPQSMQRRPCSRSSSAGSVRKISWWSRVRVRGSRSGGSTRSTSRKPRGSAITRPPRVQVALQRALVVVRDDLRASASKSTAATRRAGALAVLGEQRAHARAVVARRALRGRPAPGCSARRVDVEHVGDPAAHARGEVAPGRPEHDARGRRSCTRSRGRRSPRPPRRRPSCAPRSARPPARGRTRGRSWRRTASCCPRSRRSSRDVALRPHRDHAAREPLAGVVVDVAEHGQLDARRQPRAEVCPAEPRKVTCTSASIPRRDDLAAEQPADGAVAVGDRVARRARPAAPRSARSSSGASRSIVTGRERRSPSRPREQRREVEVARLPVVGAVDAQQVDAADQVRPARDPQRRP